MNPTIKASVIFSLLAAIFFFQTLFGGKTYVSPDSQSARSLSTPMEKYLGDHHEMPQWSPYIFCGMPSFGSLMYAPFVYMPGIPFYPLKLLPGMVFPVLHFIFAGLGVFVFLQRKKVDFWPSILGGVAFMYMPYLVAMEAHGHGSQMMTASYIPWALWSVDRLLEKVSPKNVGLAGLILGFQLQRGHVQISYYIFLLVLFYAAWHCVYRLSTNNSRGAMEIFGGMLMASVLAFGMSSILYLPVHEYSPYSIRGAGSALAGSQGSGLDFDYAAQWSFPPAEVATFILPSFFGFGGETYWGGMPFTDYPNYMGIVILGLAVFGLYSHIQNKKLRSFAVFSLIATIVILLLSFGKYFFLYEVAFKYLPYFDKFRVPSMILILLQYLVALWSGFGLQEIFNRVTTIKKSTLVIGLFVFVGVVFSVTILREPLSLKLTMIENDIAIRSILVISAIAVLLALASKKISISVTGASFVVLSLIDLWQVDYKIGSVYPKVEKDNRRDAVTAFLQSDSTGLYRLYPRQPLFGSNYWAEENIESIGGYHAAKPRLYQDFIEGTHITSGNDNPYLLGMLNVRYMLSPALPSSNLWKLQAQFQYGGQELGLYENKVAQPRAYLVGSYETQSDAILALSRLRSCPGNGFDPRRKVLLSDYPEINPTIDTAAAAEIIKYDLHRVTIKTKSVHPQILVLSDGYYPAGWQAYIDTKKAPTLRANYAFRAVSIPGGEHWIEFRFESSAYSSGMAISIAALIISLVLIAFDLKKTRKVKTSGANNILQRDKMELS